MTVVNPLPPGVPGPATIARIGFELAGAINRAIGGGISRADKERLEAGRRQGGYVRTRTGWIAPDGGRVTERTVIEAGRDILSRNPPGPGQPGYRPDLTETVADKKPPKVAKQPRTPRIPGRAGRIIEGIATVAGGTGLFEVIRGGIERVREPTVTPPPPRPAAPPPPPASASPNEIIGGRPPFYAPPTVKSPPPAPVPRPAAPAPAPRPAAPDLTGLEPIQIYTPYVIPPAAPAPSVTATAAPRSVLGLSPAQLAGIAVPTLLALLAGGAGSRRRRDPLTVPQTPLLPGLPDIPGLGLTPGSFPLPWPGGSGIGGGGTLSATGQCECPPKRKRGPKKRRSVCYSGTYVERASGLSKSRKRKIPCR